MEDLFKTLAEATKPEGVYLEDRKIITRNICPPIPSRKWDWQASREDWDLGDLIGEGETKEAAIADLLEQEYTRDN